VLPYTIGNYLAEGTAGKTQTDLAEFKQTADEAKDKTDKLLSINGSKTVDEFHRELGKLLWNNCGMARNEKGLKEALAKIPEIREEFWKNVKVPGDHNNLNQSLESAGRVADFMEFAEILVTDALNRKESCGGHFRDESKTDEGEAKRDDDQYAYVAAWEFKGVGSAPTLHKEELKFEEVKLTQRSYK
ncbi:Succinate dehydrogenase flavoprotein subunit, partial [hydrothermal vent metagenome]